MQGVVDLLQWHPGNTVAAHWRSRYEDALESRIRALAGTDDEETRCLLEALDMLPSERRRAFLRAPQIASRLLARTKGSRLDCGPIARGLLAELAVAGVVRRLEHPVWTALGDRLLAPHLPAAWGRRPPGILESPIVVDKAGPMDFTPGGQRDLARHETDEAREAEAKVLQAARAASCASPAAWQLVTDCIDVIALRRATGPASGYSSSSFRFNARSMLIVNAHLPSVESASLSEHMVHEAIHSLLFMYEESEAPFVRRNSEAEWVRLRSPWSGKELFLSAYVHACVTWYGLYWFWGVAAHSGIWPARECERLRERARRGFDSSPVCGGLACAWEQLSPAARAMLEEVEAGMPRTATLPRA